MTSYYDPNGTGVAGMQPLFVFSQRTVMHQSKSCRIGNQDLIAPIIIPFAKYFCRNGYTHMTGTIVAITAAILIPSGRACWGPYPAKNPNNRTQNSAHDDRFA